MVLEIVDENSRGQEFEETLFINNEMARYLKHLDREGLLLVIRTLLSGQEGKDLVMQLAYDFDKMYEVQK